jgi:hypothetical protein
MVILTRCRNEERQIGDFLDMCGSISEGVLLLDDHSSDKSLYLAKSHPAVLRAWESFQRTDGCMGEGCDYVSLLTIAQAYDPDWVLILDVDERLDADQFNSHKEKIFNSEYNSVSLMWPYCDETNNKAVFWGYGPKFNKNQIKIPFKRNILMRFADIAPLYTFQNNKPTQHCKPFCKNQKTGWCNIVLKHLCVRPAKERIDKWQRRLPLEDETQLGYSKDLLLEHVEILKKLPPDSPSYDRWMDTMMKEYGAEYKLNSSDFYIGDKPSWSMLFSHLPHMATFVDEGKELIY